MTGNVELVLFRSLIMNKTLRTIWNNPLQKIRFQLDNGTDNVFLSNIWIETDASEEAKMSKKLESDEHVSNVSVTMEATFL